MAPIPRATFSKHRADNPVLAARIVHEAALAITPHTPGDDHTEPASRAAAVAVLRVLVADQRSCLTANRRAEFESLALLIEKSSPGKEA